MQKILETELILNKDGSIYHLNLMPGDLAETIILVGDPSRVPQVSKYFDRIDIKKKKREFVTHTGYIGNFPLSVVSTGIGVDNVDIVMNEIDALFNIDFNHRSINEKITSLRLIRLGTCGGLSPDLSVDSMLLSTASFAFDGLMHFYKYEMNSYEKGLHKAITEHFKELPVIESLYVAEGANPLIQYFKPHCFTGITLSCAGFYGPQSRSLRAPLAEQNILQTAQTFGYLKERVINFEMETSGIYALGRALGHQCCTINTLIANRITHEFSKNSHIAVDKTIQFALDKISRNLLAI